MGRGPIDHETVKKLTLRWGSSPRREQTEIASEFVALSLCLRSGYLGGGSLVAFTRDRARRENLHDERRAVEAARLRDWKRGRGVRAVRAIDQPRARAPARAGGASRAVRLRG